VVGIRILQAMEASTLTDMLQLQYNHQAPHQDVLEVVYSQSINDQVQSYILSPPQVCNLLMALSSGKSVGYVILIG